MILILAAAVTTWDHDAHDSVVRDGGVIDMISLLNGSLLVASAGSESGGRNRARRKQVERTYVARVYFVMVLCPKSIYHAPSSYSDALLVIPERVQSKFRQSQYIDYVIFASAFTSSSIVQFGGLIDAFSRPFRPKKKAIPFPPYRLSIVRLSLTLAPIRPRLL